MTAIIEIIGATIVPVVVINAIGLLGLVMQNRYSRIKDRIYGLLRIRDETAKNSPDDTKKLEVNKKLLKDYLKEMKLVKNAMLHSFLSIVCIVLTCFMIMVSNFYLFAEVLALLTFSLGLILLLVSVVSMSRSLMLSIVTVSYEIRAEYD